MNPESQADITEFFANFLNPENLIEKIDRFFLGTPSSSVVNTIILILFLLGLVIIGFGWRRIFLDSRALIKVRRIVQEATKGRESELLEQIEKAAIAKKCLVVRAIHDILQVKKRQGNVEALSDALRASYIVGTTWSRYISSILIILGLMGTIIGLSMAIVNLRGILMTMGGGVTASAFEEIIKEILGSLNFMETAFSTTMCGFVFYLLLSFADHAYQNIRERFSEDFETFVSKVLIPFFTPEPGVDEFVELAAMLKASSSSLNQTADNLGDLLTLTSSNQEIYGQIADNLHGTVNSVKSQQEEMAEYYGRIAEMFENFNKMAAAQSEERRQSQQTTENLFKNLGGDRSEIEKLYQNVNASIKNLDESFMQSLSETAANLKVAVDLQNQEINRLESDHDAVLRAAAGKMAEFSRQSRDVIEDLSEKSGEAINKHANQWKSMLSQMAAETQNKLAEQKNTYDEKLTRVSVAISEASAAIGGFQKQFMENMDDGFQRIAKDIPALNEKISNNFSESTEKLFGKLDNTLTGVAKRYEQSAGETSNLTETLKNFSETQTLLANRLEKVFGFSTKTEAMPTGWEILKLEYVYIMNKLKALGHFRRRTST